MTQLQCMNYSQICLHVLLVNQGVASCLMPYIQSTKLLMIHNALSQLHLIRLRKISSFIRKYFGFPVTLETLINKLHFNGTLLLT